MTTLWTYDFEAGVASGTVMTTANSNFKNLVQPGWTFSNAHLLAQGGGALAGRCATSSSTAQANDNARPWASTNVIYYRFYMFVEQVPSASTNVLSLWAGPTPGPSSTAGSFRVTSSGQGQIRDASSTQSAVSGAILVAGTYARVEGKLDVTNNQQQLQLYLNSNVHGTTADYDSGLVASSVGGVGITSFGFGMLNSCTGILHFDNLEFSNSGFIGPVVVVNQPPTANAGPDQTNVEPWTTVTLVGSDSDPDGTIASRTWTQTGGAAVTYTTVSANSVSFTAPATINGDTGSHKYTVTDNGGSSASDIVSVTTLPVTERAVIGGVEVPMRIVGAHADQAINPPGAPQNVVATISGTAAPYSVTITWEAPLSDGGSPVTGYAVTRRGNGTHNLGVVFTDTFTNLTATPPYTFDVVAINAVGQGPAGSATTSAATNQYRFPGDTLPLVTGKIIVGCDENDNDGTVIKVDWEFKAPEADTGIKYGAMKYFYNGSFSNLTPGTGQMFTDWAEAAGRGHIILASMAIQQNGETWAQSATRMAPGGTHYSSFYNFIAGVEESTTVNAPFWFVLVHEPQSKANYTDTSSGMSPFDYADMQKAFRAIMDDYATAKAGSPSAYTWKKFSFGGLETGEAFSVGSTNQKSIDNFFRDSNGVTLPSRTWDWGGSDAYQQPISGTTTPGRTGVPQWNPAIQGTISWCEGKGFPAVIGEYGIHNTDADAGTQLQIFWDNISDGTHDVVAILYWNSAPDGPMDPSKPAVGRFLLTDYYMNNPPGSGGSPSGNNGGLYSVFKTMMQSPKNVHYWDLGYPKPPGV